MDGSICHVHLCRENERYFSLIIILFLLLAMYVSGCGSVGKYNPDPNLGTGVIESIDLKNPVKIVNIQDSDESHILEFKKITVNYKDFTQSLVEALKMEYQRNNVEVTDATGKELRVAVTDIAMYVYTPNYRARISAEVSCGDDNKEFFHVTRASYASPFMMNSFPKKPLEAAFKELVKEIINNKKIRDYINE